MKKNILFGIGIMTIIGLSLVWFVQNIPIVSFSSNEVIQELNVNYENDIFDTSFGDEIKLGDSSFSLNGLSVLSDRIKEYISYTSYSQNACSSECTATEILKDSDGNYTDSSCSKYWSTCYKNKYDYSYYNIYSRLPAASNIILSPGESINCESICSADYPYTCELSGACTGSNTTISYPGKNVSVTHHPTTTFYRYGNYYKTHQTSIKVKGCSPGWQKVNDERFFKHNNISLSEFASVFSYSNPYLIIGDVVSIHVASLSTIYRVSNYYVRCGVTPVPDSVCAYKPTTVAGLDNTFENADGYMWTDDPKAIPSDWVIDFNKDRSQCGGCFGNATTLAASTNVRWGTGVHGRDGYKLDKVSSTQCYARETPKVCEPVDQNGSPTETLETDKCDDEENVYFVDGKWCNGGEPFYEIKCLNKYANEFDLEGKDVEVEEDFDIKQGVSVGIEVKTEGTKLCSAKFFSGTWDTVYFQVIEKLKAVDIEENSVRNAADVNEQRSWYITVLTKVLKQVNEYIDWKAKNEHNPTVKVELKNSSGASQKLNSPRGEGGQTVINFQYKPCTNGGEGKDDPNNSNICIPRCKFNDFDDPNCFPKYGKIDTNSGGFSSTLKTYKDDIEKDREGKKLISIEDYGITFSTAKISFRAKLNESKYVSIAMPEGGVDLSKVKNFMWYTEDKDEVTLIPPKVSLNWLSGEVLGSTTPIKVVDGYNRLYTDEEAEKGEQFKLEVHLENIGSSKSRVFDNICKLNVVETELTYRTIEETNPFINESRKKGYNWYRNGMDGTLYDFTKVIQGGGGYSASYEFSRDAIKSVKASNASLGKEAYLGACYLGLDSTSAICSN